MEEHTGMSNSSWSQLWLKYERKAENKESDFCRCYAITGFDKKHPIVNNALAEWERGIKGMLNLDTTEADEKMLNTGLYIFLTADNEVKCGGYKISENKGLLMLEAQDESGVLYGIFHILRQIAQNKVLEGWNVLCNASNPLRVFNHWDNMDGSIERGYSGKSFFFEDAKIIINER